MKHALTVFLILLCCTAYSQDTRPAKHPKTKEGYLSKSREQRMGGFILLGAGIIGIAAVAPGNAGFGTTGSVALLSTAAILGSVPLFLAARRNKRKSRKMSAYFQLDKTLDEISLNKIYLHSAKPVLEQNR
jgi:hypothetical protein